MHNLLGKQAALEHFGLAKQAARIRKAAGLPEKKAGQTCNCASKHCAICSLDKMKTAYEAQKGHSVFRAAFRGSKDAWREQLKHNSKAQDAASKAEDAHEDPFSEKADKDARGAYDKYWKDYKKKTAAIFGATEPDVDHDGIPLEVRQRWLQDYHKAKGSEQPTGYGKAMGVGGLIGGLAGAGFGLLSPGGGAISRLGAALGGGVGALGGAGLGALMAAGDKANIEHARASQTMSPEQLQHLIYQKMMEAKQEREMQAEMDRMNEQSRHDEHMGILRGR